jgi:glycosyltransferase involved in cell wall biosynthesis
MGQIDLSVVVPVYKEAANIKPFLARLLPVLERLASTYEVIFCLDPSPDTTEQVIQDVMQDNPNIHLLVFSRRFGQPSATMAGILHCKGARCAVIDVDLQDPPELLEAMVLKLNEGFEVVYAERISRKGETFIKRCIAYIGYKLINKLSDVNIPKNTGDFRVMTRRIIEELRRLNESHGFLRGLVAYVGFKQGFVQYHRDERLQGKGNYNPFTGSLRIGLNGLISFSSRPLQMMSVTGGLIASFSFLLGAWYVLQKFINIDLTPGLSTTVLVVTFCFRCAITCVNACASPKSASINSNCWEERAAKCGWFFPITIKLALCSQNNCAMCAPKPWDAPVKSKVCPCKLSMR